MPEVLAEHAAILDAICSGNAARAQAAAMAHMTNSINRCVETLTIREFRLPAPMYKNRKFITGNLLLEAQQFPSRREPISALTRTAAVVKRTRWPCWHARSRAEGQRFGYPFRPYHFSFANSFSRDTIRRFRKMENVGSVKRRLNTGDATMPKQGADETKKTRREFFKNPAISTAAIAAAAWFRKLLPQALARSGIERQMSW